MKHISVRLVLIFLIISLASAFQTFIYVIRTPKGFVYPLVHNYEQDYYWYLSLMRQGWDGFITVTTKFTPEVFPRIFVNTFFPFFGMVARATGISLPIMYLVLRIGFGAGLLIAGYILLKNINVDRKIRMTAVAFFVFGAPFWFIKSGVLRQVGEFWTGFDPILRVAWLPHHLAANIFLIFSIIFLARAVSNQSIKTTVVAAMFAVVGSWFNPAILITLAISGAFAYVSFVKRFTKQNFITFFVWGTLCCIPVFAFYAIQNSTFPWTAFRDWERFVKYPVSAVTYLGTLGLVGVLGFLGIPVAFGKKTFLWNSIVGWFLSPFIGLFVSGFFPISNGRFIQTAGYIPAAVLASLAIWNPGIFKKTSGRIQTIVIGLIIITQLPSFAASYIRQMGYVRKNMTNGLVMVPRDYWDTVTWLSHTNEGVIIAPDNVSSVVGAFTPLKTYAGHPTFTFEPQQKQEDLRMFYFSQDDTWRLEFITVRRPDFIWVPPWGPRDSIEKQGYAIVYKNPSVFLYQKQ